MMTEAKSLTETVQEIYRLKIALAAHQSDAKAEENRIRADIRERYLILEASKDGIDLAKVALAKTVVFTRGTYANGGDDRASVVEDAIAQLATGEPIRPGYGDLWRVAFGTKTYSGWYGQRSDHEYGFGPRHGFIIFQVGLVDEVRKNRAHTDLTPDEIEAAVYYLTNLERVQAVEADSKSAA